jgi:hypothetical protein
MLNKNQSRKRNSLKYALIIPALIAFVILFQIEIIAQEKRNFTTFTSIGNPTKEVKVKIDKNSSEAKLKSEAKRLKEEHGITLKCSKVKRNSNGEITEIKVEYKDKNGNKGTSHIKGDEPIEPFVFFKNDNNLLGFAKAKNNNIVVRNGAVVINNDLENLKALSKLDSLKNGDIAYGISLSDNLIVNDKNDIVVNVGKNPKVIVNGKVITDAKMVSDLINLNTIEIEKALAEADKSLSYNYSYISDNDNGDNIIINGKKLSDYTSGAVSDARVQVNKMKREMRTRINNDIEKSRTQIAKSREDIAKAREDIAKARIETREAIKNASTAHSDKTKNEIEKVKAELQKVKEEMAKAKEELEREKAKQKR